MTEHNGFCFDWDFLLILVTFSIYWNKLHFFWNFLHLSWHFFLVNYEEKWSSNYEGGKRQFSKTITKTVTKKTNVLHVVLTSRRQRVATHTLHCTFDPAKWFERILYKNVILFTKLVQSLEFCELTSQNRGGVGGKSRCATAFGRCDSEDPNLHFFPRTAAAYRKSFRTPCPK